MFQPVYNPFSKYADKFEKKVDKLFKNFIFYDRATAQKKLLDYMQENLVVVDLWLEKEFKGYQYLKKFRRRRLYQNTQTITQKFEQFCGEFKVDTNNLKSIIKNYKLDFNAEKFEKITYISHIMAFLRPGHVYEYLEGASFRKLLVDLQKEKMIGDCNQIVTFYTFLYALKFPINDLKIKILPGHVCLHFDGIDIEATNGTFQQYEKFDYILNITELISTNLLDVSDFRDKTNLIEMRTLVKGAELAYSISSMRELVEKNLQISYQNVAIESSKAKDFSTAEFFLKKVHNQILKKQIFHNAVIYYCQQRNFSKAKFYVQKLAESGSEKVNEMNRYVLEQEGMYYFKNGNLSKALSIFKTLDNRQMIKACYAEEFNRLQKKIALVKTTEDVKRHKDEYNRMLDLAKLMEDESLAQKIHQVLRSAY